MKHSIRQRVIDPVTGLKVTKVETVNGELGSGLFDKNGKEIFEGDIVQFDKGDFLHPAKSVVEFKDGEFIVGDYVYCYPLSNVDGVEVVGHVEEDAK